MFKQHITKVVVLTSVLALFSIRANAQEVNVVDNKGTIQTVNNNNVTRNATAPTNPVENDIWFDSTTNQIKIYVTDDLAAHGLLVPDWVQLATSTNWLTSGNSGLDGTTAFLGTTDNAILRVGARNHATLQIGRRSNLITAGQLTTNTLADYNVANQELLLVKDGTDKGALQFGAANATQYKPILFSTNNGNFRIKASAGYNDRFEIGSTGSLSGEGNLEIMIGDDGIEPITFKRYHASTNMITELFRVQGSGRTNGSGSIPEADIKTRFGININPAREAFNANYNSASTGTANTRMATSTFEVNGSTANAITTTTAALTLDEEHHTIIINGAHNITLPLASICTGREYILKNQTNAAVTIDSYQDLLNTSQTSINANTAITIQSDGTNWHAIDTDSHTGTAGSVFFANTTDGAPTEDNTNFFWDDTNNYLGIGTNAPSAPLHISAPSTTDAIGTLRIEGNEPDIVFDDTDGGFNTFTFRNAGVNKAAIGRRDNDNFYITINNGGWDDDAFVIKNSNSFVGISVADPNSTLQINGSVSKSIFTTTAGTTLTENNHTVILGGNHNIGLPVATTCEGRIYVIKNNTTNTPVIDSYLDATDTAQTTIPSENILWLQSNGTEWEQINSTSTAATSSTLRVFEAYDNAGGIAANETANTYNVLNLDTARTNIGGFTLAADVVTIPEDGVYEVGYTVTFIANSNGNNSTVETILFLDSGAGAAEVDGSSTYITLDNGGGNPDIYSSSKSLIISLTTGDELLIASNRTNSANGTADTVADGTNITIKKLD